MPRILDIGAFSAVREADLAKLLPAVPRVAIGMGTCGRGNGAEGLFHAFAEQVQGSGMSIVLVPVGCFGACFQEPMVNVRLSFCCFKSALDNYKEEIEFFGTTPTMYAGLVDGAGNLQLYDGGLRFRGADGQIVQDHIDAESYFEWIGEASLRESYLKAPYFKPQGYPAGIYRVGPLGRLNAADRCGTPKADSEFNEFHQRFGTVAHSAFLYHYARLIEIVFAKERIEALLHDPQILDTHARATAGVNTLEGVGMIEAPRDHSLRICERGLAAAFERLDAVL
jgi:NAD-reducing hydrogenase large subunit